MHKLIIGIDPGTTESGFTIINNKYEIIESSKIDNEDLINYLSIQYNKEPDLMIVIESIQSYGMQMGKSIIETCYMIGRIIQFCHYTGALYKLIPRPEYGKNIVGGNKINDALIRTALENRFGSYDKGKKEKKLKSGIVKQAYVPPGPLVLLSGSTDQRSAFALCVYYIDQQKFSVNSI